MKFWINCVSKNHVLAGVEGKFTQAGHGQADPLKRLSKGDAIAFYSSGTLFRAGELLQAFTAIGRVADDAPYQATVSPQFRPWRRRVTFVPCDEAPILPLIPDLTFISDKANWGMPLRRGLIEISADDFAVIARAMNATLD